jgi:hypothetical protein
LGGEVNGLEKAKKGVGVEGGKGKRIKVYKGMAISTSQKLKYKRETHEMGVEGKKESK